MTWNEIKIKFEKINKNCLNCAQDRFVWISHTVTFSDRSAKMASNFVLEQENIAPDLPNGKWSNGFSVYLKGVFFSFNFNSHHAQSIFSTLNLTYTWTLAFTYWVERWQLILSNVQKKKCAHDSNATLFIVCWCFFLFPEQICMFVRFDCQIRTRINGRKFFILQCFTSFVL